MEEERAALRRELERLNSELIDLDFSGMSEAERAAEAERLRRETLEEARRLKEAGDPRFRVMEALARIIDFDPKDDDGMYFNRLYSVDLATFDHDEESPLGPMRFTKTVPGEEVDVCQSVNFLSVKIACSDVGFPIQVYGTVIARDCMDYKCVYLFRRDRDNCQLINSKDESLILTGPKRGLVLLDANFVEADLKIKDHQGQDRELSKGIVSIRGLAGRSLEKCEVESKSLATRLSTVDITYAVVIDALEATV
ncbi:hypothetical protein HU200_053296 [Digitaria exilis]|uniref:DUF6598 domain-containing protein n=1 Tax=Digitaria exilis TaxID=1010633 RepID=A0A835E6L8_9POAL|nr:hypothetical protein HU200_053296 [Digitaria exilis]